MIVKYKVSDFAKDLNISAKKVLDELNAMGSTGIRAVKVQMVASVLRIGRPVDAQRIIQIQIFISNRVFLRPVGHTVVLGIRPVLRGRGTD